MFLSSRGNVRSCYAFKALGLLHLQCSVFQNMKPTLGTNHHHLSWFLYCVCQNKLSTSYFIFYGKVDLWPMSYVAKIFAAKKLTVKYRTHMGWRVRIFKNAKCGKDFIKEGLDVGVIPTPTLLLKGIRGRLYKWMEFSVVSVSNFLFQLLGKCLFTLVNSVSKFNKSLLLKISPLLGR